MIRFGSFVEWKHSRVGSLKFNLLVRIHDWLKRLESLWVSSKRLSDKLILLLPYMFWHKPYAIYAKAYSVNLIAIWMHIDKNSFKALKAVTFSLIWIMTKPSLSKIYLLNITFKVKFCQLTGTQLICIALFTNYKLCTTSLRNAWHYVIGLSFDWSVGQWTSLWLVLIFNNVTSAALIRGTKILYGSAGVARF